jgi:hypothetical protein
MPAIQEDRVDFTHAKWSAWVSAALTMLSTVFILVIVATPALNGSQGCPASDFQKQVAAFVRRERGAEGGFPRPRA